LFDYLNWTNRVYL